MTTGGMSNIGAGKNILVTAVSCSACSKRIIGFEHLYTSISSQ